MSASSTAFPTSESNSALDTSRTIERTSHEPYTQDHTSPGKPPHPHTTRHSSDMQRNLNGGPSGRRQSARDLGGSSWNGAAPGFTNGRNILRNGIGQDFIPGLGDGTAPSSRINTSLGSGMYESARSPAPAYPSRGYHSAMMGLPPHRGRRDSNSSNATFATQLPDLHTPRIASHPHMGSALALHRDSVEPSVNSLGAGFETMRISDYDQNGYHGQQSNALSTVREGNGRSGTNSDNSRSTGLSRNDSLVDSRSSGSVHQIVQMIKAGETEDPYDRSLNRYDTPAKLPNPTMGPARFKDSKMFSNVYGADSAAAAPASIQPPRRAVIPIGSAQVPDWLSLAQQGLMRPSAEEAGDALPMIEGCLNTGPSSAGVLRIKDIPYGTTRAEMTAFIGRNAQILRQPEGSPYHAVHIIMERESGKTMDCFIEVTTANEAAWVSRQFGRRVESRRQPKVGDRQVEVLYSSQDELMAELFPRAKHVRWCDGQPMVDKTPRRYYADQVAAGFQGFLHPEELVAMGKHANLSDRSPFASKSPSRVYEAMISLLHKYPWYATTHVTISERRRIFDCAIGLIRTLAIELRRGTGKAFDPLQPTSALLQELAVATLTCVGFSEKQKASIVAQLCQAGFKGMADGQGISIKLGGNHEISAAWPFYALHIKPGADIDLLKYYASLFREATARPQMSLAERQASRANRGDQALGNINIDYGSDPTSLSMAEVAVIEYDAIEQMLNKVCSAPAPLQNGFGGPASIGGPGDKRSNSSGSDRNGYGGRNGGPYELY